MRSLQERKTAFSRYRLGIAGALLLVVLFFFAKPPAFLEDLVFGVLRPVASIESGTVASSGTILELLRSKRALVDENARLKQEMRDLNAKGVAMTLLEAENESLRAFAGRNPEKGRLRAGILLRPPETPYDSLVIDAGQESGIRKGDKVYAYGALALGTVEEVGPRRARVTLYSSPGVSTSADILQATTSVSVSLIGQGGGNFIVQLPRGAIAATNSPIALPGITSSLVALVGALRSKAADSFETALAKSPVNIRELRTVEIAPASATSTSAQ